MSNWRDGRLKVNLILLLLAGGLGMFTWWQINQKQAGPELLLSISPDQVQQISMVRRSDVATEEQVRFERRVDGGWQMRAPHDLPANPVRLRQLFTLFNETVKADYEAAGMDLAKYGLQPADVTLRFNQQQLRLGIINPVSNDRYVLHNNRVKLVSENIYGLATNSWFSFVALNLVPDNRQVTAVELPGGGQASADVLSFWQNASALRIEALPDDFAIDDWPEIALQLKPSKTEVGGEAQSESLRLRVMLNDDELILIRADKGISYVLPGTQKRDLLGD